MIHCEIGSTVLVQEVWRGRLWSARPFVVVHHEDGLSALWMPVGTMFKGPSNPTHRPRKATPRERMLDNLRYVDWGHRDVTAQASSLWIVPHDAWYSAQRAWLSDGRRLGWYVNFQEPLRQLPNAFRTMDLALDLVVHPDGTHDVKDRSEFEILSAEGLIDEGASTAVLASLDDVRRRLAARSSPFSPAWEEFEPPDIAAPVLPAHWDALET